MKLKELINKYEGNGFYLKDKGNGCAFNFGWVAWDKCTEDAFGQIEMHEDVDLKHDTKYQSDWITDEKNGNINNTLSYKIYF